MANGVMGVVKSVSFGLATGAVVGYMGHKIVESNPTKLKRKAKKAINTMNNLADTAKYMLK